MHDLGRGSRVIARARGLRATALLAVAALAVHQLRMALEGGDAGGPAHSTVHHYLPVLASAAAVLVALALTLFAASVLQALTQTGGVDGRGEQAARDRGRGFTARWGHLAGLVLAAHLVQQLAEGTAAGHPLAGFAVGGLLVAAAGAALAGAVVAALLGGANRALVALRGYGERLPRRRPAPARWPRPQVPAPRAAAPLARHLAGRAPPAAA